MLKKLAPVVALLCLACGGAAAQEQRRGPSTPEQRRRVVEMATFLEQKPLDKEAKKYREALLYFLTVVPDITVKVCLDVLGESKRVKGDYESELVGQLVFSQAKFVIENPGQAKDDAAAYLAGVEGVLRTWQSIRAAKPKAKFPLLDELSQKQQAGTLAEYVKAGMAGCAK